MHFPYLMPGEQVVDVFYKVWLETPDRVDKLFTKFLIYNDRGILVFTNIRIIFQGAKYFFPMQILSNVSRHRMPGKVGTGEGYVRIDSLNPHGQLQTLFFAGGGMWVWSVARRSDELFRKVIAWKQRFGF